MSCSNKNGAEINSPRIAFDKDSYALYAFDLQNRKDFKKSAEIFYTLFQKTGKNKYLEEQFASLSLGSDYKSILRQANINLRNGNRPIFIYRYKQLALANMGQTAKAIEVGQTLVKKTNDNKDRLNLAQLYLSNKVYKKSIEQFRIVFNKTRDETLLLKIADIYRFGLRDNFSSKQTLTNYKNYKKSETILKKLTQYYMFDRQYKDTIKNYELLYRLTKAKAYINEMRGIYISKKLPMDGFIEFLRNIQGHEDLLLQVYVYSKRFKDAAFYAYQLYKKTKNYDYLGKNALYIYEYEPKRAKEVINKLIKVNEKVKSSYYQNFLGYLLIDENINTKKGIFYVKQALSKEKDNALFLDSLAWGYYRLNQCKKAQKILNHSLDILKSQLKTPPQEILEHQTQIKRCLKNSFNAKTIK